VRPSGRLILHTGTAAKLVNLQLLSASGDPAPGVAGKTLRAYALGPSKRRWAATLPRTLDGADLVTAFVRYSFGDASFAARVRTDSACGARS
jgi:hypothetical protein